MHGTGRRGTHAHAGEVVPSSSGLAKRLKVCKAVIAVVVLHFAKIIRKRLIVIVTCHTFAHDS